MADADATITIRAVDKTREAFEAVNRNLEGMQKSFKLIGKIAAFELLKQGIESLIEPIKKIVDAAIDAQRSQNQLTIALRATGLAAGLTASDLESLEKQLEASTAFDGDDIRKAETALLRFRDVQGDTYTRAIKLTLDLATAQGSDGVTAAEALGKALADPTAGMKQLAHFMSPLTEQQKLLIDQFVRTGNIAGAQKIILDNLAASIGGAAAGENTGLYGSTRAVSKAWDDFLKALGRTELISVNLSDAFSGVAADLKEATDALDQYARAQTFADKAVALSRLTSISKEGQQHYSRPEVVEPTDPKERAAANAGKAKQDAERYAEAYRKAATLALKDRISFTDAALNKESQLISLDLERRQGEYDYYYEQGLHSTKGYYDARLEYARRGLDAEVEAIQVKIAEQRKLLKDSSTTPEQKGGIKATIEGYVGQQKALSEKYTNFSIANTYAQEKAERAFQDSLEEVNAQLEEQQGYTVNAADRRFDLQNRTLSNQIRAHAIDGTLPAGFDEQSLNKLRQILTTKTEIQKLDDTISIQRQDQANIETHIGAQIQNGQISTLQGLRDIDDARKDSAETLRKLADTQDAYAQTLSGPEGEKAKAGVRALRSEIEALEASAHQVADQFRNVFESSFVSAFDAFATGTEDAGKAFTKFARDVATGLQHIATQKLAEQIFGGISGGATGGVAGGIGGFLTNIFTRGSTAGGAPATNTAFAAPHAAGGPFGANQMFMVGERGPEMLYTGNQSGNIIPNNALGGGGMNFTQVVNVAPGTDPGTLARVMFAAKEQAKRELTDAWRRGTGPRTR